MSAESEGDVAAELGTNCNLGKTMAWCVQHGDVLINRDDNPGSSRGSGGYTTKYSCPALDHYTQDHYAQDRNTQDRFNRSRSVNERPAQNRSAPSTGNWKAPAPTPTGSAPFTCFACGQPGHKAAECPQNSAAQKSQFKGSVTRGRLNHLDAEEAQTAPDVVYGMFLVNGNTASVLFDSRATCSYISSKFA